MTIPREDVPCFMLHPGSPNTNTWTLELPHQQRIFSLRSRYLSCCAPSSQTAYYINVNFTNFTLRIVKKLTTAFNTFILILYLSFGNLKRHQPARTPLVFQICFLRFGFKKIRSVHRLYIQKNISFLTLFVKNFLTLPQYVFYA